MTSRKRTSDTQALSSGPDPKSKKAKTSADNAQVDTNGDPYWEISKMRRVTVSSFRGKTMVNVREYYEKDGQELPGKKGISMPVAQFAELVKLLPDIEEALGQKGESLPRPAYSGSTAQSDGEEDSPGKATSPSKQNIEATSDEDEGEE